ncbi:MAG: YihY/virulence factor BrkB family protein [Lentisphaeria bacterium]|nr:YihY/virulence factor BrkB family protein [Lentisphaeria bacterium]
MNFREKYSAAKEFLCHNLWLQEVTQEANQLRLWGLSVLRILVIVVRDFVQNKIILHSSALTFTTLMSIVPLIAMIMAIAKGLNFDQLLVSAIEPYLSEIPGPLQNVVVRVQVLVLNTDFKVLGVVGSLALIYAVIHLLTKVEVTMNEIWGIRQNRSWSRKLTNYLSIVVMIPILLFIATSISTILSSSTLTEKILLPLAHGIGGDLIQNDWFWFPFVVIYGLIVRFMGILGVTLAFCAIYLFMPNTAVKFKPAFLGALVAGVIWFIWQAFCLKFQFWLTGYNTIYGTLASLPVALIWINVNWLIMLFGAVFSFACQHYRSFQMSNELENMSHDIRRRLCYRVMFDLTSSFVNRDNWSIDEFCHRTMVPYQVCREVVDWLGEQGLIHSLDQEESWVPAASTNVLTLLDVEKAVNGKTADYLRFIGELPSTLIPQLIEPHEEYLQKLSKITLEQAVKDYIKDDESLTNVPTMTGFKPSTESGTLIPAIKK